MEHKNTTVLYIPQAKPSRYIALKAATQLLKDLHNEQDEATETRSYIRTISQ